MIFFRFKNDLQVNTPVIQPGFQSKIQKWSTSTLGIYTTCTVLRSDKGFSSIMSKLCKNSILQLGVSILAVCSLTSSSGSLRVERERRIRGRGR